MVMSPGGGGGVIQVFAFLPSACPLAISLIVGELPFCDCILNAVLIKRAGGGGGGVGRRSLELFPDMLKWEWVGT